MNNDLFLLLLAVLSGGGSETFNAVYWTRELTVRLFWMNTFIIKTAGLRLKNMN
jgi:hypothetical protein